MDFAGRLEHFGVTRQEATLYECLLRDGDNSGYEVAKLTGISRSNVYTGLAALVDKGAAWLLEGATARYTAVPLPEFCANRLRFLQAERDSLMLASPSRREDSGAYITIRGRTHILDKLRNLVAATTERVYLSLPAATVELIVPELEALARDRHKIVLICDRDMGIAGVLWYRATVKPGQIRVIVDSTHVLTGDIGDAANHETAADCTCLYSDNRNLVDLFKTSIGNEIRLLETEGSA